MKENTENYPTPEWLQEIEKELEKHKKPIPMKMWSNQLKERELVEMHQRDQSTLKMYSDNNGHKKLRLTTLKMAPKPYDPNQPRQAKNSNDEKESNNVASTRGRIHELAYCNPWQWFITLTLNPKEYDRTDLDKFAKDLARFIRNQRRNFPELKYLLIPELHNDNESWHMHGFLMGLPEQSLHRFKLGETMGKAIATRVKEGETVFEWKAYTDKFGFNDIMPIKSHDAVTHYVTKYITKDLNHSVKEVGAHMYYCSQGLHRAEVVKKGQLINPMNCPSFENQYVQVTEFEYTEDLETYILESFAPELYYLHHNKVKARQKEFERQISGGDTSDLPFI